MIYVFYNNDPLASDQGGGAEHLRGIYRALKRSKINFKIISSRMQKDSVAENVMFISSGANILNFFLSMIIWFMKNRSNFSNEDVFHFHRNYLIWPKYLIIGKKGRTIITYHNLTGKKLEDWFGRFGTKFVRRIMLHFERSAVSLSDRIIFVSDRVRQALKDEVLGNNYNKTVVIPAAFDSDAFKRCSITNVNLSNKIVTIGRLASIKNFDLAIEVLEMLCTKGHDYYLTIVGDGELKEQLDKRVQESKFKKRINLYGRADHKDICKIISNHGIVLVTSKFEASPTIVKEGIASKRPVVTTDVGDVSLWISNGNNGYICEHTSESLVNAILKASQMITKETYNQKIDLSEFSEKAIMDRVIEQYAFTS